MQTKIEEHKEEDFVIRSIFQGKPKNYIVDELNRKHPEVEINTKDIDRYIQSNSKIFELANNYKIASARRFFEARADVEEKMAQLILFTESLIKKYDDKGDNQSTVAALNILNKTLMNYAKLAGYMENEEKKEVKNIINIVSDRHSRLASQVISADFKMVEDDGRK